jgi:peptide/nickel transport system permease protein
LMASAAPSLLIAGSATLIGLVVGVPLGLLAASRRGLVDDAVARASDLTFAFPALISAILGAAAFGPSGLVVAIAVGIFNIPVFARVTRSAAQRWLARDMRLAARAAGKSDFAIAIEHVLPNISGILIVQATVQLATGLLAEAALAYVGLGVQPPQPSWGRMLADSQTFFALAPWLALAPGLAVTLCVLGFSLLGDGLRDRLDLRASEGGRSRVSGDGHG